MTLGRETASTGSLKDGHPESTGRAAEVDLEGKSTPQYGLLMEWLKDSAVSIAILGVAFMLSRKSGRPNGPTDATGVYPKDEKLQFELKKLKLETRSLARQLSWHGSLIEWLKASAVPVTLLGAVLAFYVGFGQLKQSEQNRVSDRFDKALARLASKNPVERITGVSGLRLFIVEGGGAWQSYALQSLVDAMAYETDGRVENTIVEIFASLRKEQIATTILNGALQVAVEHNRSLTKMLIGSYKSDIQQRQKKRIVIALQAGAGGTDQPPKMPPLNADEIPSPIPVSLISKLSRQDYLSFLDEYHGPFTKMKDEDHIPLQGLVKVINILIALGAKIADFSDIYCPRCDFSPAIELPDAKFERSFLNDAVFSHMILRNASFQDADLSGVSFYAADLRGSNLQSRSPYIPTFGYSQRDPFPLLECAKLQAANLTGIVLINIAKDYSTTWSGEQALRISSPKLSSAEIDQSTTLESFAVVVSTAITDAYLAKYPSSPAVQFYEDRQRRAGNKLFGTGWSGYPIARLHYTFAADETKYTDTIFTQRKDVDRRRLNQYSDNEIAILHTFLDQPTLRKLALVAEIFSLKTNISPASEKIQKEWSRQSAETCRGSERISASSLTLGGSQSSLSEFDGFKPLLEPPLWE